MHEPRQKCCAQYNVIANYNKGYITQLQCSCFINDNRILYGLFLAPLFAVLLFNTVVFVMVAVVLIKHTRKKLAKDNKKRKEVFQGTLKAIISIISVMVMFGLSWFFGALSISDAAIVFQWLFVIFNTSQGFILFLFSCVIGKDARDEWIGLLTCNRNKHKKRRGTDSHSHSSKATISKYRKTSGSATRQTDLRSKSITSSYTKSNKSAISTYNSDTLLSDHVLTSLDNCNLDSIAEETKLDLASEPPVSKLKKELEAEKALKTIPETETPTRGKTKRSRKKNESILPPHVMFRLNRPYYEVIVEDAVPPELSQETDFTETTETVESAAPAMLSQETDFTQESSVFDVYANLTGDSTVALIN